MMMMMMAIICNLTCTYDFMVIYTLIENSSSLLFCLDGSLYLKQYGNVVSFSVFALFKIELLLIVALVG